MLSFVKIKKNSFYLTFGLFFIFLLWIFIVFKQEVAFSTADNILYKISEINLKN